VLLEGKPIFQWSVDLMLSAGCDPVILTLPPDALDEGRAHLDGPSGVVVVEGGETRQRSVALGLAHVEASRVVVHDAARPLATEEMVRSVLHALDQADGAITAVPVGDTVKRAPGGVVDATLPRSDLWHSQTPQAFATEVLRKAHAQAEEDGFLAGDDAELVERYGGKIALVPGSRANIKITFEDDFRIAEALARTR
jgi:2-C-methyl-D-erythritol 4-phosphate cytidylyltransferase